MDQRLRVMLRQAAAGIEPPPDLEGRVARRVLARQRRRRGVVVVATAMVLVAGSVGARTALDDDETSREIVVTEGDTNTSDTAASEPASPAPEPSTSEPKTVATETTSTGTNSGTEAGSWRTLPAPPDQLADGAALAWTGSEVLVFDGRVGSAFEPVEDVWRVLPDAPVQITEPISVWTGTDMIVWGEPVDETGQPDAEGAVYNPATDSWRPIADAPLSARTGTTTAPVWTGTEMLVWSGSDRSGTVHADGAAYDPASDRWRTVPPAPIAPRAGYAAVWTGTEALYWGGLAGEPVPDDHTGYVDGAAYSPSTDTWQVLPPSPLTGRSTHGIWTGQEMLVLAGYSLTPGSNMVLARGDSAAYSPSTDSWRRLADGPGHPGYSGVWTGQHALLFAKAAGTSYDPATDRWTDLPVGPHIQRPGSSPPAWTGAEAVMLSYDGAIAFRPAPSTSTTPVLPTVTTTVRHSIVVGTRWAVLDTATEGPFEAGALLGDALVTVDAAAGETDRRPLPHGNFGDYPWPLEAIGNSYRIPRGGAVDIVPADPDDPVRSLGAYALVWVPSTTPGRIWTVSGHADGNRPPFTLTEIDATTGVATSPAHQLPETLGWPVAAVNDGILVQDWSGAPITVLVDRDSGERREVLPVPANQVLGTHDDRVVWVATCHPRPVECDDLRITDLSSGSEVTVRPPDGVTSWLVDGSMSPAGDQLAVIANTPTGTRVVVIVDAQTGTAAILAELPGTNDTMPWTNKPDPTWSTDGQTIAIPVRDRTRIMLIHLTTRTTSELPITFQRVLAIVPAADDQA
jgi:hypothetical protein